MIVPEIRRFGPSALLLELADLDQVLALAAHLEAHPLPGVVEAVPAARTVLLRCASARDAARAAERCAQGFEAAGSDAGRSASPTSHLSPHRTVEIEVVYDGADLAEVARLTGLSEEAVVNAHTGTAWTGAFGGFAPGFTYLAGGDPRLNVPRRESPRTAVPAGAVALAGEFSAVYPRQSPGGWQLIGHTDAQLWDLTRESPALIAPLDTVRFTAVRASAATTSGTGTGTENDAAAAAPSTADTSSVAASAGTSAASPGLEHEGLEVLDPGLQSLLQDSGRPGSSNLGVPVSGAADADSARLANHLVGNPAGEAVVEILLATATFRAADDQVLALTGAAATGTITPAPDDDRRRPRTIATGRPFALLSGETLTLSPAGGGLRTYLALRGGIDADPTLGSRATDTLSGLGPAPLAAGTRLGRRLPEGQPGRSGLGPVWPDAPLPQVPVDDDGAAVLRVTAGPRDDWFEEGLKALTGQAWLIGQDSNRVGVRLQLADAELSDTEQPDTEQPGTSPQPLRRSREGELASEGMVAGALQVPPSGLPVLFLADHPVTGGYPVVATVIPQDLPRAAQLPPGTRVRFAVVPDPDTPDDTASGSTTQTTRPAPTETPGGSAMTNASTPEKTPIRKVLIANRGEIAVRIARACADAGLESVAVYSDPDADALHVRRADEAYPLAGRTSGETYLDIEKILRVARESGADAVHPGYGFLSENADFAEAVIEAGLAWVGPAPQTIRDLGDKIKARQIAVAAGAPLVPGTDGPVDSAEAARAFAEEHGLPVIIKAAHGGGGRGMRIARELADVEEAFAAAVREAEGAFGRGECFVERFLDKPRHVEAQVLADTHGNVVVIGTRDCSLQRRNQKLVEEAPAPFLTYDQRARIHSAAREICRSAGYVGAGTVEFMVAPDGLISFLEVNTRLQVEHPITEETTGVDLVAEQLRIAAGEPLSLTEDPAPRGHAFEFRINAEDPARGFLPTPGDVTRFEAPTGAGVRVDTGVRSGSTVPDVYDSMMAKLIVSGATREQALRRARVALEDFQIDGVATVLPFHRAVLQADAFTGSSGFGVYTTWIEDEFSADLTPSDDVALPARSGRRESITVEIDGRAHQVGVPSDLLAALRSGGGAGGAGSAASTEDPEHDDAADGLMVASPVDGGLVKWAVDDGATVAAGDPVAVVEAMKTESPVTAHRSGVFTRADLTPGDKVSRGQELGRIEVEGA